ncbi:hypothetical protein PROFUN_13412 [Planoprotostelium fungivorum]|uniref:Uncharacterized protein n=1 Tax=Planoprotostelium fungivorum TaxID=1890364 RepID=A0A2P6N3P0_9EUKA|nr:hypothetical protein PROFUN_13412 [Planoprotostelium fungivorum]
MEQGIRAGWAVSQRFLFLEFASANRIVVFNNMKRTNTAVRLYTSDSNHQGELAELWAAQHALCN